VLVFRAVRALTLALVLPLAIWLAPACSIGQGTGCVAGTLNSPDCWSGPFDLHPDFFAANPTNGTALQIRIQNGIDYETFSDGLAVLIDDIGAVRGDPLPDSTRPSLLGQPLVVGLPASVTPPGVPVKAVANPTIVHAALYLDRTCRTQNVALYAMDAVSLEADGTCNRPPTGETPPACGAPAVLSDAGTSGPTPSAAGADASSDAAADAQAESGAPSGVTPSDAGALAALACGQADRFWPTNIATSTMTFTSVFDGNLSESNAQQRLTDATFDLYLADPREICPGGLGPPPRCRGHLQGSFHFYFQRGRPAQPFP
jgi:hypothetical protein